MTSRQFFLSITFLFGLTSVVVAESDADFARAATWHEFGDRAPSQNLVCGLREFYSGNLDAALKSFTTAAKSSREHPALYALSLLARGDNDYQKSLKYLCEAVSAGKNSPWAELYLEQIWNILPYCADTEPFLKLVEQAAEDARMRPCLRDLARAMRGRWLMQTGRFDAATEVLKPLQ